MGTNKCTLFFNSFLIDEQEQQPLYPMPSPFENNAAYVFITSDYSC